MQSAVLNPKPTSAMLESGHLNDQRRPIAVAARWSKVETIR